MLLLTALSPHSFADALPPPETWTVAPGVPGAMLPAAGRSLFDHLFAAQGRYDIPFPFTRLVAKLEAQTRPDGFGRPGVKRVLIPLGRSLQRGAGVADPFRYPRVVIAVDGEPKASGAALLKDRLYIGYQETGALLEVISYNEAQGRFEFQVVKDYRAGTTPRVFYANRTLCSACHQNGAPIFARQQWDETNANPALQRHLARHGARLYDVEVARGVDEPYAIDAATDRANRLAATQLLWQRGCGDDDARGAACRAAALTLALQSRLSGSAQFDLEGPAYRERYVPALAGRWQALWPQGLHLPDPDVPNRDPIAALAAGTAPVRVDVPAPFDPLAPRAPLQTWEISDPGTPARAIRGLAEFLADDDVLQIDRRLQRLGAGAPVRTFSASCAVTRAEARQRGTRLSFRCPRPGAANGGPLRLRGRLYERAGSIRGGSIEGWSLGGTGALQAAQIAGGTLTRRDGVSEAHLTLQRGALGVRTQRGNAVERIALRWRADGGGEVQVTVREDFAVLEAAVALLQGAAGAGTGALSAQPFRRAALMPALLRALGAAPGRWCCLEDGGLPAPAVESVVAARPAMAWTTQLYRYCAVCHQTDDSSPPNFLHGDAALVRARLAHCAPRMFVRLAMWGLPPQARAKSPMPPPLSLSTHGLTAQSWREDGAWPALLQEVRSLLLAETGRHPELDAYLAGGYESLRPCLPEATQR